MIKGNYLGVATIFCHEDTKKSEGTKYFSLFFLRAFEKLRAFVAFGDLKSSTLAVTIKGKTSNC